MPSKEGWTHERDHEKITLGKKQYRNMEEWTRPCCVCGEKFAIYTRTNGDIINSSFGLKTCKPHRGERPGVGGMADPGEVQRLRAANATMTEELEGLYERVRLQFEEIQVIKARLATYELAPAMHAIGCEAVQNTTNGRGDSLTFPWR